MFNYEKTNNLLNFFALQNLLEHLTTTIKLRLYLANLILESKREKWNYRLATGRCSTEEKQLGSVDRFLIQKTDDVNQVSTYLYLRN